MRQLALLVAAVLFFSPHGCALLAQETESPGTEPPGADEPMPDVLAAWVGTFLNTSDFDAAFLHVAGSFEPHISESVDFVGEIGVVFTDENDFVNVAPALRLYLSPTEHASPYLRVGPALWGGLSGGSELLAHAGFGIDLARATTGLRFEVRTYVRPGEPSFDVLEVLGSVQVGAGE